MWRRAVSSWFIDTPSLAATEMPSPRGLPIIGTTLDLIAAGGASRLHEYVDARHRQLGPIYRDSIGPVNGVFVADPNEMRRVFTLEGKYPRHILPEAWVLYNKMYGSKRGLFFMDGEEWQRFRRIMNRLWLLPSSGYEVIGPCDIVATDLVDRWTRKYNGRELIGLESELYRWAIKITVAVLMGDKYSKNQQLIEDMVEHFTSFIHLIFQESAHLSLIPASVAAFLKISAWRNFVSAVDEGLAVGNSLISLLMPECQNGEGLLGALLAEGIEHKDVVRIVVDLCLAAGDTIASSIQWMMYLLARHPNLQDELYADLLEVHKPEDIVQLHLLRGMMREALRLYPVAPFLSRYLPEDSLIGGYRVPAGDLILLSMYTSGHDAKNFPEPSKFWPQRWTRDADGNYKGVSNPFASLPFAMGARSCIGRRIAETQITLTVAKVIKKFKLELMEKEPVDMVLRLVAVPSRPVRLWLTER